MKTKIFSLVFLATFSTGVVQSLDDLDSAWIPEVPLSISKSSAQSSSFVLEDRDEDDKAIMNKQKEKKEKKKKKKKEKSRLASKEPNAAPKNSSTNSQGDLGNWTEVFQTSVGEIYHAPNKVSVREYASARSLYFTNTSLYGVTLSSPLMLETNSTREVFIKAMKKAGII